MDFTKVKNIVIDGKNAIKLTINNIVMWAKTLGKKLVSFGGNVSYDKTVNPNPENPIEFKFLGNRQPDGTYEISATVWKDNMIENSFTNSTERGIIYEKLDDGGIWVHGTATANVQTQKNIDYGRDVTWKSGKYIATIKNPTTNYIVYFKGYDSDGNDVTICEFKPGTSQLVVTVTKDISTSRIFIRPNNIVAGVTVDFVIYPYLTTLKDDEPEEPKTESFTISNLTEPLRLCGSQCDSITKDGIVRMVGYIRADSRTWTWDSNYKRYSATIPNIFRVSSRSASILATHYTPSGVGNLYDVFQAALSAYVYTGSQEIYPVGYLLFKLSEPVLDDSVKLPDINMGASDYLFLDTELPPTKIVIE